MTRTADRPSPAGATPSSTSRDGRRLRALVAAALGAGVLDRPACRPPARRRARPPYPTGLPAGVEAFQPYVGQGGCDPVAKPGVRAFSNLLMATYRDTGSLGIVRDCGIGGSSEHKEGRAFDWAVSAYNANHVAEVKAAHLDWLTADQGRLRRGERPPLRDHVHDLEPQDLEVLPGRPRLAALQRREPAHRPRALLLRLGRRQEEPRRGGARRSRRSTTARTSRARPRHASPAAAPAAPAAPRAGAVPGQPQGARQLRVDDRRAADPDRVLRGGRRRPEGTGHHGRRLLRLGHRRGRPHLAERSHSCRSPAPSARRTGRSCSRGRSYRSGRSRSSRRTASPAGRPTPTPPRPIDVQVLVDKVPVLTARADRRRPDIATEYPGVGTAHGYDLAVQIPAGTHSVCVVGVNVGAGVQHLDRLRHRHRHRAEPAHRGRQPVPTPSCSAGRRRPRWCCARSPTRASRAAPTSAAASSARPAAWPATSARSRSSSAAPTTTSGSGTRQADGLFSDYVKLDGPVSSRPSLSARGDGRVDLVARARDGRLLHRMSSTPGAWSGWVSLGGDAARGHGARRGLDPERPDGRLRRRHRPGRVASQPPGHRRLDRLAEDGRHHPQRPHRGGHRHGRGDRRDARDRRRRLDADGPERDERRPADPPRWPPSSRLPPSPPPPTRPAPSSSAPAPTATCGPPSAWRPPQLVAAGPARTSPLPARQARPLRGRACRRSRVRGRPGTARGPAGGTSRVLARWWA